MDRATESVYTLASLDSSTPPVDASGSRYLANDSATETELRLLREAQVDLSRTVERVEMDIRALAADPLDLPGVDISQLPEPALRRDHIDPAVLKLDISPTVIETDEPTTRGSVKYRFDELKVNFLARYASKAVKAVLFLGTTRGDGASTVAFNFAQSLARDLDTRVMFVSADLRAPSLDGIGLSNLPETDEVYIPPTALHGNVHVLPSGRNYADPAALFQSKRFNAFMSRVSEQFDYVVLDGPPLDEAPEAIALSTRVDGVILTIDSQRTRRRTAVRAKARIEQVGGNLLGVVLNRRKYYVPDWLYRLL
jgi:capsular exopolysaccharide synthesis family protein